MNTPGDTPEEKPLRKVQKGVDNYLRFTGLGFTMIGIILVFTYLGWWIDQRLAWKYPVLTIVLSLSGILGAMLYLFKETARPKQGR